MEFRDYKELVKAIPVGKHLPDAVYVHESALNTVPTPLAAHLVRAITELKLAENDWNIVKFFKRDPQNEKGCGG